MKHIAEVVLGLSVVGAWYYVAVTLLAPARAASAPVAARAASDSEIAQVQPDRLIARR